MAARPPRASPARFAALHSPPPYAEAKGAYADGVAGLRLRGVRFWRGAPLRRGHPPLCDWCFGLAPPYAGAKGACWWVYDVLGCVLGVVGLPCWGFGWILNWVKILG